MNRKHKYSSLFSIIVLSTVVSALALAQSGPGQKPELVLQTGHTGEITNVALSSDGRWLASSSEDHTVKLWDVASNRLVLTLAGGSEEINAVAFSPDGHSLAAADSNGKVKLWDTSTRREVRALDGGTGALRCVAFSPDGRWVASGGFDKQVTLWEVATWKVHTFPGQSDSVDSVVFSRDGRLLASSSGRTVTIWDFETSRALHSLIDEKNSVHAIAFSPDGRLLASGGGSILSAEPDVNLWEVSTGLKLKTLTGYKGFIKALAFSPDGRTLASGSFDGAIRFWDVSAVRETREVLTMKDAGGSVNSLAFSPNGKWLATGSGDLFGGMFASSKGEVNIWDVSTGKILKTLGGYSREIHAVALSPNGSWLAFAGAGDTTVKLLNMSTRTSRALTGHTAEVWSVAFSRDGRWLASASNWPDSTIKLWDVETGLEIRSFSGHDDGVRGIAFSSDGRWLASASFDHTIKLWELSTESEPRTIEGCKKAVNAVAFSGNSQLLASGCEDGTVKVWEVASGSLRYTLEGAAADVWSLAFSPDGRWLASGSGDISWSLGSGDLRLWDLTGSSPVRTLVNEGVRAVAFSNDGHWLTSGGIDHSVKVWNVNSGQLVKNLSGHSDWVNGVAFASSGGVLASCSRDGTIRFWDSNTGQNLAILTDVAKGSDWLAVTPDGLFDGSVDGAERLVAWRIQNRTFPPSRFFNDYYTPNLLSRVLVGERPKPVLNLNDIQLPPTVAIALAKGSRVVLGRNVINVEAKDQGGGVSEVRLFQNGKLVGARPGRERTTAYTFEVEAIAGENDFKAVALSRDRVESDADHLKVLCEAPEPTKPALHLLVVGVSRYADSSFNLDFARLDGEAVAAFFAHDMLFRAVDKVALFDKDATKAAILQALMGLAERAEPQDVLVIYFAGHGISLDEQFYFLPYDMQREAEEQSAIAKYGIPASAISDALLRAKPLKQVLILDSCESEGALPLLAKTMMFHSRGMSASQEKAVTMLAHSHGFYLIAASAKQQSAFEIKELGHGTLTYALLSGLGEKGSPQAQLTSEGIVTMQALILFVNQQVPKLMEKYHPGETQNVVSWDLGMDFPLWAK